MFSKKQFTNYGYILLLRAFRPTFTKKTDLPT